MKNEIMDNSCANHQWSTNENSVKSIFTAYENSIHDKLNHVVSITYEKLVVQIIIEFS